jgi:hypothetical protein
MATPSTTTTAQGTPDPAENRRVLYAENGEWARHYSNVRMTVITFVVTACVAILALKWDADVEKKPEPVQSTATVSVDAPAKAKQDAADVAARDAAKAEKTARAQLVGNSVILLWLLGASVFQGFTYYTLKRMRAQLKHRGKMLMPGDKPDEMRKEPYLDLPSFALFVVTLAAIVCLLKTEARNVIYCWLQVLTWAFLVWSLIFPFIVRELIKREDTPTAKNKPAPQNKSNLT